MIRTRSFPVWAALLGSGLAGVLVALQSRINGGLSQRLGNGYVTAAVSFGIGLLIMCVALLVSRRGRAGFARLRGELRESRLPGWALLGGAGGALFVLSQGLITPLMGLTLFTVGIVAGQVLGGLVMDRVGLGPGGRIDPTPTRIAGTVLAVIAVALSVGVGGNQEDHGPLWLILVPVFVGAGMAAQSMVNGLVRAASQSAVTSTFINFVVGTALLGAAAIVSVAVSGWPTDWPSEPYFYIGGFVGTIFIAVAAMLVRTAGVLLLSMSNVAGQLIAAVAFELGAPLTSGLTQGMIAGTAVALLAVVVAALPWRGRSATAR
ncbi:DMT family transporter [Leucobacter chromiireducens]|uniref:DMT family transporter n=1 Tax=Leucobacter chromiireducens TaxID=283877 RepID=UPI001F1524CB|nr:DMT family transporter [Leucobacter chromiireducens]